MTIAAKLAQSYKLHALLVVLCAFSTLAIADSGDIRAARTSYIDGTLPVIVTWDSPFTDDNYTAVCTSEATGDFLLPVITSRSASSMTVVPTDFELSGRLDCIAIPDSDTSDLRHGRESYESNPASVTIDWNVAFADTNYTAVCTGQTFSPQDVSFTGVISNISPGSVTFTNGGLFAGTIHCIGIPNSDTSDIRRSTVAVSGSPQTVQITWNQPFLDSNYAAVCSDAMLGALGSDSAISILPTSKLPQSMTVQPELESGFVLCLAVQTDVATNTTLDVSPSSASAGQVVTLSARVLSGLGPVTGGTVTFSSGTEPLGTVQIVRLGNAPGTATLRSRFAPGAFNLTAHFNGTSDFQASTSSPAQLLTVTGAEPTISTLTVQPDGSNYDFTLSVFGFGFPPPSGPALSGGAALSDLTLGGTLVGNIALPGPGLPSFHPPPPFPIGGDVLAYVASADFNGDGIPDLAVPNTHSNTVSVFLGNGDGTFRATSPLQVGAEPVGIAVADFNGDGFSDLVVANNMVGDNTVSVLLGNGDGTFQPQHPYSAGEQPFSIAVGDFNGDGFPDLVVSNQKVIDSTATVLLNNGDGTFSAQPSAPTGFAPESIAVGDFNQDGFLDVAVVVQSTSSVNVLLGNGDGTLQPQTQYGGLGTDPFGVAVADLNGDGFLDLAVTNYNAGQDGSTVSVLLGDGHGAFQLQPAYPAGAGALGIVIEDVNGDGFSDLVVANSGENTVSVYLGNGNGTFQPRLSYPGGDIPVAVAVADYNGDGVPDVAAADSLTSEVSILLGGTVTSGTITNIPIPGSGSHDIQSTFTPNGNFYATSLSNEVVVSGPVGTPTNTTVVPSINPSQVNQAVTFTATVTSRAGAPMGTVTFTSNSNPIPECLSPVTLDGNGVATCSTRSLPAGSDTVSATYSGNSDFAPSSGSVVETVNPTSTSTTLLSSQNPANLNQPVTLTAVVTPSLTGGLFPSGTVTFTDNGNMIRECPNPVPLHGTSGASCTTSSLPAGSNTIKATYNGDGNFTASNKMLTQTINSGVTTTTLTSSQNPSNIHQAVTFTATITSSGSPVPEGNVTFQSNGVNIPDCPNPATVVRGVASCTTQSLAAGADTILATFSDPQGVYVSSFGTLQQVVSGFTLLPISPAQVTVTQSFTNLSEPFFAQTIHLAAQPATGYSGTVTLSCSVAPALTGGSCAVNSPSSGSLATGDLDTTLTISAGATTPIGSYTVTVTAQDNNGVMQLATLALTVINQTSGITMPPGGANRIHISLTGTPGTVVTGFSCPLVTGTGITGSGNLSQIGGVCTFEPGSVTLPGTVLVTISGCTVASLRTRTQFFAAFWLGMPALVLLGSVRRKNIARGKTLRLIATLLTILVVLMGVGCGGGYGPLTPTGFYSVLVQGTGPEGTVYSAVVPVTVVPLNK